MWVSSPEAGSIFEKRPGRLLFLALVASFALAFVLPPPAESAAAGDRWEISEEKVLKITTDRDTITFDKESVPLGELAEDEEPAEAEKPKSKRRSSVKIGNDFPGGFNIEIHGDEDDGDDVVRFGESIIIEEDDEVSGDVVAIGGSIEVRGSVLGDVVAVGGSIHVKSTGRISGDAVAVGGTVIEEEGSEVGGDVVNISGPFADFIVGLSRGGFPSVGLRFMGFTVVLVKTLIVLLLIWLIAALFTDRMKVTTQKISQSPLSSFGMGLLIFILLPVAIVLLCITLIGIPVAILLPLAIGILSLFGYAAVGLALGSKITGTPLPNGAPVKCAIVGVLIMEAIPLVSEVISLPGGVMAVIALPIEIIGYTIIACAVCLGLGAAVLTKLGRPPLPVAPAAPASGIPPAAPPPGAGATSPSPPSSPPPGAPHSPPPQG